MTIKIIFVKRRITLHNQHHASGGQHAFACLARALAADDDVSLLFAAPPGQVLAAAAGGGWLRELRPPPAVPSLLAGAAPPLASWARSGVQHFAAQRASDLPAALATLLPPPLPPPRLPSAAANVAAPTTPTASAGDGAAAVVVIDADETQSAAGGALAAELAAAAAVAGARCVFFVQNAHHLPFGPHGCAPRAPALLRAWASADGVLTASRWLLEYLNAHAPPPAAPAARFAASLAAAGAFGPPPWPDRGATACEELWSSAPAAALAPAAAGAAGDCSRQITAAARPVILMLKRTPEKGAALFDALAALMPECDFVAVDCSGGGGGGGSSGAGGDGSGSGIDGDANSERGGEAAREEGGDVQCHPPLPPNVRLVPPTDDLDALLSSAHACVAPSLVAEGFGMAAVDAALRGVPCVVAANAGALPEAGLGAASAAPVALARLPLACGACGAVAPESEQGGSCPACGAPPGALAPSWARRIIPADQPAAEWAAALRALLGRHDGYEAAARAARAAALAFVDLRKCAAERAALRRWLASLGGGGGGG